MRAVRVVFTFPAAVTGVYTPDPEGRPDSQLGHRPTLSAPFSLEARPRTAGIPKVVSPGGRTRARRLLWAMPLARLGLLAPILRRPLGHEAPNRAIGPP